MRLSPYGGSRKLRVSRSETDTAAYAGRRGGIPGTTVQLPNFRIRSSRRPAPPVNFGVGSRSLARRESVSAVQGQATPTRRPVALSLAPAGPLPAQTETEAGLIGVPCALGAEQLRGGPMRHRHIHQRAAATAAAAPQTHANSHLPPGHGLPRQIKQPH